MLSIKDKMDSLETMSSLSADLEGRILSGGILTQEEASYLDSIKDRVVFICRCNYLENTLILKKRNETFYFSHIRGLCAGHAAKCLHYKYAENGYEKALSNCKPSQLTEAFVNAANFTVSFYKPKGKGFKPAETMPFDIGSTKRLVFSIVPALRNRLFYGFKERGAAFSTNDTSLWFDFKRKDNLGRLGPYLHVQVIKNKKLQFECYYLLAGQGENFIVYNKNQGLQALALIRGLKANQRLLSQYHVESLISSRTFMTIRVKGSRLAHCLIFTENKLLFDNISSKPDVNVKYHQIARVEQSQEVINKL